MCANNLQIKNKRAISELVAYVLLITLAVSMAAVTYAFLKPYAEKPLPEEECPDAINIVIEDYACNTTHINISLKNRGLFNVTGVVINELYINGTIYSLATYPSFLFKPNTVIDSDYLPISPKTIPIENIVYDKNNFAFIEIIPVLKGPPANVCTNSIVRVPVKCTPQQVI